MNPAPVRLRAVLRTDIVRSTNYQLRVGDGVATDALGEHLRLLDTITAAHGGTITMKQGDGMFAVFDSALAAIRAAQEIQATTARQGHWSQSDQSDQFELRIGVSVGELAEVDGELIGRAMIEAERLQSSAESGQILCTATAAAVTGGRVELDLIPHRPVTPKGFERPLEVVAVRWTAADNPLAVLDPMLEREPARAFVGRAIEFEQLSNLWRQAVAGHPRIVFIEGEAGVGKSRIARELAVAANETGAVSVYGACYRDDESPYGPLSRGLEHYVGRLRNQVHLLGPHASDLLPLVPDLANLLPELSLPSKDDVGSTERATVQRAVEGWLGTATLHEPMLILLEDLQWADLQTLSLLEHLTRRLVDARLLIVATCRPPGYQNSPVSSKLAELHRAELVTRLNLGGLDHPGTILLMEAMAGHTLDGPIATAFAEQIFHHTNGNPFFVEAVLEYMAAQGALVNVDGRWTTLRDPEEWGAPPAVREAVRGRLVGLSDMGLRLLQTAAVLGSEFNIATLRRLSDDLALGDFGALSAAVDSRLLHEVVGTVDVYRFSHEIVRSTFESELGRVGRARIHELAARAISDLAGGANLADPDTISHHLSFSLDPEVRVEAAVHAVAGGQAASRNSSFDRAGALFQRALRLLEDQRSPVAVRLRTDALLGASTAAYKAGDPSAAELLASTIQLADELGDGTLMARAALIRSRGMFSESGAVDEALVEIYEQALGLMDEQPSALRSVVLANLGAELTYAGDRSRQVSILDEAEAMARYLGDKANLFKVLILKGNSIWRPATSTERLELAAELEHLSKGLRIPGWQWAAASFGFQASMEAGLYGRANVLLRRMERLAERIKEPMVWCFLNLRRCVRSTIEGRFADALEEAEQVLALGTECGRSHEMRLYYFGQKWIIYYHQGRLDEVGGAFREALRSGQARPVLRPALAAIHAELNELDQCAEVLSTVDHRTFQLDDQDLLVSAAVTAIAANAVNDRPRAQLAFEALEPYEGQMIDNGSAHFGAVAHYLGLAAATLGRREQAIELLGRAVNVHSTAGYDPMTMRSRIEQTKLTLAGGTNDEVDAALTSLQLLRRSCEQRGLWGAARAAMSVLATNDRLG